MVELFMNRIVHIQDYLNMNEQITRSLWEKNLPSTSGSYQLESNTDLSGCHHLWASFSLKSERNEKEVQSQTA